MKQRTRSPSPMSADKRFALNAVCPYFTMFPLEYPMRALQPERLKGYKRPVVVDPYCGRGTTVYAARLRGVAAYGVDVAPVAVAIAQAKLVQTTEQDVLKLFDVLVAEHTDPLIPHGSFWKYAYAPETLRTICALREGLSGRRSAAAILLRAIVLGALHGPRARNDSDASYLSNQMPRTFAAKPDYAVRFWTERQQTPPRVDVRSVVQKRVRRVLAVEQPHPCTRPSDVKLGDSRFSSAYDRLTDKITHVVTSPPYYGLRTYSQDQWLRNWFLGGPDSVDYGTDPGLDHGSPERFARSLSKVWDQIGDRAHPRIRVYVRFGGIGSRNTPSEEILRNSFKLSAHPWRILTKHSASSASEGKRQAIQMRLSSKAVDENDYVVCIDD